GDQHQVVKNPLHRQVDIHQLGDGDAHQRQKNALHRFAHPAVLHGRLAHDGGGVNGIAAMGDAGEVKYRILIGQRIKSGVVAERAFAAQLVELDVAFEDDFCVGGDFEVYRLAS